MIIPTAIEKLQSNVETGIYLSAREHKPFWSTSSEDIERRLRRLQNTLVEKLRDIHGLSVNVSRLHGRNNVYWVEFEGTLVYEADVKLIKMKDGTRTFLVPYQSSVWRDSHHAETASIPTKVFWQIFDNSPHRMIASDLEQSREGRAFWQYRIKEALGKGYKVSLNYMGDDSNEAFRDVVLNKAVRNLTDLRGAYSTDFADGTESFLLIQRGSL